MNTLPRIRSGLLTHDLDSQLLVSDSEGNQVHLLDPTSACVMSLLQEGGWTMEGMQAEVTSRLGIPAEAHVVALAIDELRNAGLLEETGAPQPQVIDAGRREVVKKLALAGAAAFLIPAITTLTATKGYAQATGSLLLCQGPCTADSQCAGGLTCGATATCGSDLQRTGHACTVNGECCSGACVSGTCA